MAVNPALVAVGKVGGPAVANTIVRSKTPSRGAIFFSLIVLDARVARNRVFLRKSSAVVRRLGKKPGFFVGPGVSSA